MCPGMDPRPAHGPHGLVRRLGPTACLAVTLAFVKPPDELGLLLPPVPVQGLPTAAHCTVSLPQFGHLAGDYFPPGGTITMDNDGGWCGPQFFQTFHTLKFAPAASVRTPPSHGQVRLARLADRLVVAYRPTPGFTGTDQFVVHTNGPIPHDIPLSVTVR